MAEALMPHRGKGKELCDLLRAALNVPQTARWFEVRFEVGEVVTVRTEYLPTDPEENDG